MSHETILDLMKGGRVKRYHAESLIGPLQKVSEHSWGVVILVNMLWPDASKELILAAIYHDAHEGELGDIPAPTKRLVSKETSVLREMEKEFHDRTNTAYEANLPDIDREKLKIADYLELVLFCQHQCGMGNNHIRLVGQRGVEYVEDIMKNNPRIMTHDSYITAITILNS